MFHGPRKDVLPFFSSLGFQLPERKGIADFLQEVTSKKDQRVEPLEPAHIQHLCDAQYLVLLCKDTRCGLQADCCLLCPCKLESKGCQQGLVGLLSCSAALVSVRHL